MQPDTGRIRRSLMDVSSIRRWTTAGLAALVTAGLLAGCAGSATTGAPSSTSPGSGSSGSTAPTGTSIGSTAPVGPPATTALFGRRWVLVSLRTAAGQVRTPISTAPWLQVEPDGRLTANGGCNSGGGTVTADGSTLVFGTLVHTELACQEQARMEQENEFFATLAGTATYRVSAGELSITGANGAELTLAALPEPSVSSVDGSQPEVGIPETPGMSR
jgi:heat shock protein HslJ